MERKRRASGRESEPSLKKRAARKQCEEPRKEFTRLKLNGTDYHIGDVAVVKEWKDERCYGTILKIWSLPNNKSQAYLRLRWYYKPADVFPTVPGFIGADELFDSDHEQDITVQAVYDKVRVLSFDEYFCRPELDDDIFYCRARYNTGSNRIDPPIDTWPTVCVCKAVKSPNDVYVECEECQELFHFPCVGLTENDMDKNWACDRCRKK